MQQLITLGSPAPLTQFTHSLSKYIWPVQAIPQVRMASGAQIPLQVPQLWHSQDARGKLWRLGTCGQQFNGPAFIWASQGEACETGLQCSMDWIKRHVKAVVPCVHLWQVPNPLQIRPHAQMPQVQLARPWSQLLHEGRLRWQQDESAT